MVVIMPRMDRERQPHVVSEGKAGAPDGRRSGPATRTNMVGCYILSFSHSLPCDIIIK